MLNAKLRQILLFITMVLLAAGAAAGVYKWVDEDGHVQFGDRPPLGAEDGGEVKIRNKTITPEPSAQVDRSTARDRLLEQYQREREEKKEAAAKKRKEKSRLKKMCTYARSKLTGYLEHGLLYDVQDDQERRYLTDKERDAEIAKARMEVKKWCR